MEEILNPNQESLWAGSFPRTFPDCNLAIERKKCIMLNVEERTPVKEDAEVLRIKTDALLRETSTNFIRQIGDAYLKHSISIVKA